MERTHRGAADGGLGRGEAGADGELARVVRGPGGEEYSIEAWIRAGWPFMSGFYELVLGWLHERVLGYQIRIKRMPVSPTASSLHQERVRSRDQVTKRIDALAEEIQAGRFQAA
jgi:hypothetical protein